MGVVAHFLDVTCANALLNVYKPFPRWMLLTQEEGDQGLHSRRGEEYGGIVLRYDGGSGYPLVALALEKSDVQLY